MSLQKTSSPESVPNIERIKAALKGFLWIKGVPTKVNDGIRRYDSVSMLLLRAGVPEYEISTLKMSNTWTRFGTLLKHEYGLRDVVDYYLILIAGDSSSSADDMVSRVEKALSGDPTAIAPFYRNWISKLVSERKIFRQQSMATKYKPRLRIQREIFNDPRWRAKRKIIMDRDEWRCRSDGKHAGELNVHHRNYTTSEPWNEPDENLITLCEKHHQAEHDDLGSTATAVANALKHSNWMVKHRKVLLRCIEEKLVSPEELTAFIEKRSGSGA